MHSLPQHSSYDASRPEYEPALWWWLALGGALAVAAVVIVCYLLGGGWSVALLDDVGQSADLALAGQDSRLTGGTSGLSVHITGEIDGVAEVWADNWEPKRLSGRVDWRVYHDWFSPNCTPHYRPVGGQVSGRLVVRYCFH